MLASWLMDRLEQGDLDWRRLERFFWDAARETFRGLLVEMLEALDEQIAATRETDRYELKQCNVRRLETLLGSVTFQRRYYWDREQGRWVHLLDERLGLAPQARVSQGLCEQVVVWASRGPSYRDARDRLTDLWGAQLLSHETIRQLLLQAAAAIEREDAHAIRRQQGDSGRQPEIVFIEVDGLNAFMQQHGNRRQRRRARRRREAKIAVIHEGWRRRQGRDGREDYALIRPLHVPVLATSEDFWELVRGLLSVRYRDVDRMLVVINGDDAAWIRQGAQVFARGLYQYDRFHLIRQLRQALGHDPRWLKRALAKVKAEDAAGLIAVVIAARQTTTDRTVAERLDPLYRLLVALGEDVRDYRSRLREQGFAVPQAWRGLGAAEANVDKFKNRVSKRGRSWCEAGLQAILTCLGKLHDGSLPRRVQRHLSEAEVWITEQLTTGAGWLTGQSQRREPPVHHGSFPAAGRGTQGYAVLFREILRPALGL